MILKRRLSGRLFCASIRHHSRRRLSQLFLFRVLSVFRGFYLLTRDCELW